VNERIFLARHLRTLSLHIMEAGHDICRELDPILEPSWSGLLGHLRLEEKLSVTDAANRLSVSHVHAQKILKKMLKKGAVQSVTDPTDARRTYYSLTPLGHSLLTPIKHLNTAVGDVIEDLEKETGENLYRALMAFQEALKNKGWSERVSAKLRSQNIKKRN